MVIVASFGLLFLATVYCGCRGQRPANDTELEDEDQNTTTMDESPACISREEYCPSTVTAASADRDEEMGKTSDASLQENIRGEENQDKITYDADDEMAGFDTISLHDDDEQSFDDGKGDIEEGTDYQDTPRPKKHSLPPSPFDTSVSDVQQRPFRSGWH